MSLSPDQTAVADSLFQAQRTGTPVAPIAGTLGAGAGVETAYAVQDRNTERFLQEGRRLVGRKIGLTSMAVQKQLGVDQPDYGMLFADMEYADGEELPMSRLIQPKVEAELAFVIGRDLPSADVTISELLRAIDFVLPAIEVVDSRIADWKIGILDTIADNASSGLYVLGTSPVRLDALDLRLCGMVMEHRGSPVSVGCGAACMGNPLIATQWLVRTMAVSGRPVRAGDVILSGALGPMVPARPGGLFEVRIEGAGSVRAKFGDGGDAQ